MTTLLFIVLILACLLACRRCRKVYTQWQRRRSFINTIEAEVRQRTEARQRAWIDAWEAAEQQAGVTNAIYENSRRPRSFRTRSDGSV